MDGWTPLPPLPSHLVFSPRFPLTSSLPSPFPLLSSPLLSSPLLSSPLLSSPLLSSPLLSSPLLSSPLLSSPLRSLLSTLLFSSLFSVPLLLLHSPSLPSPLVHSTPLPSPPPNLPIGREEDFNGKSRQTLIVQRVYAIHWINHYPVDKHLFNKINYAIQWIGINPLDSVIHSPYNLGLVTRKSWEP